VKGYIPTFSVHMHASAYQNYLHTHAGSEHPISLAKVNKAAQPA